MAPHRKTQSEMAIVKKIKYDLEFENKYRQYFNDGIKNGYEIDEIYSLIEELTGDKPKN